MYDDESGAPTAPLFHLRRAAPRGTGTAAEAALPEQGMDDASASAITIAEALESLEARARHIFLARTLQLQRQGATPARGDAQGRRSARPSRAPTLDAFGQRYGVTRERIRQIQQKTERRMREKLMATPEGGWLVDELRAALGAASPLERFAEAPRFLRDLLAADEAIWRTALWLAGYTPPEAGWVTLAGAPLPALRERVRKAAWEAGALDYEEAVALLKRAGMRQGAAEALLAAPLDGLKRFGAEFLPWKPSLTDKAEALLRWLRRPASARELFDLINEQRSLRGFRNRLTEDERFARTQDGAAFVLREWGLEERSNLSDAIAAWIEREGGEASLTEMVPEIAAQGAWAESSVRIYAYAPRFVARDGRVRLRRADEPFDLPAGDPADHSNAERLDRDRIRYRVEVIHDTLRGSGRPIPGALAVALGVRPEQPRTFTASSGATVRVTWGSNAPQPSLGSVKALADEEGAELGDILAFDFDTASGTVTVSRLHIAREQGEPA